MASKNVICPDCNVEVKDAEKGVECEVCEIWFHCACQNIGEQLYAVLMDKNNRISWYCNYCDRGAKKLMGKIVRLENHRDKTEQEIKDITKRIENLESTSQTQATNAGLQENMAAKITEEIEEYREREMRKCNLILHNIPESAKDSAEERRQEDRNMIIKIQQEIHAAELKIESLTRLGEKPQGNKPRMVKVKVENVPQKRSMLQNAKKLRNATDEDMKKIYVTPDLSKRAREKNKQLREELNRRKEAGEEDLMIKNGRVVKRDGATAAGQNRNQQPFRRGEEEASTS